MKLTESQLISKNLQKLTESRSDDMNVGTIKSSTGKFYIGDPCYALPDEIYHNIWGDKYDFEDGLIETDTEAWLVHGTAYGDGCYGPNGEYPVDSGTISVIPTSLIDEDKLHGYSMELGQIYSGEEATMNWVGQTGTFQIEIKNPDKYIEIVTGDYPDEDEDSWDNEEEY